MAASLLISCTCEEWTWIEDFLNEKILKILKCPLVMHPSMLRERKYQTVHDSNCVLEPLNKPIFITKDKAWQLLTFPD